MCHLLQDSFQRTTCKHGLHHYPGVLQRCSHVIIVCFEVKASYLLIYTIIKSYMTLSFSSFPLFHRHCTSSPARLSITVILSPAEYHPLPKPNHSVPSALRRRYARIPPRILTYAIKTRDLYAPRAWRGANERVPTAKEMRREGLAIASQPKQSFLLPCSFPSTIDFLITTTARSRPPPPLVYSCANAPRGILKHSSSASLETIPRARLLGPLSACAEPFPHSPTGSSPVQVHPDSHDYHLIHTHISSPIAT